MVASEEVQGSESRDFISLIKTGINYVAPIELKKVDFKAIAAAKKERKMYHIKVE